LDAYSLNFISVGLPPFIRLRVLGIYILTMYYLYLLEGCREWGHEQKLLFLRKKKFLSQQFCFLKQF
jgi:hypothetical protein